MTTQQKIMALTRQLYPTGRAFKMPAGGWLEKLHHALSISEAKAYNDAVSLLNGLLPDNPNFTEEDASTWEVRLGMIDGTGTPLEDRKLAIRRKYNHPGNIKARQHYLYVQGQLRAAGFDVYVHENRFDDGAYGYETRTPVEIAGYGGLVQFQLKDHQLNDAQLAGGWGQQVVNSINNAEDAGFNVGSHFRNTFFIGGADLSSPSTAYAYVPANREREFRKLILTLKPAHMVAYLFIVYI